MGLTFIEASKLIKRGDADAYIARFVGSVQQAAVSDKPFPINLDDALVASVALTLLADTTAGRKLLKKPKRENTQYKAEQFSLESPQRMVARDYVDRKINYPEALTNLETAFDGGHIPDKGRTLKRLLDDLIKLEENQREAMAHFLALAGWDGTDQTKEGAAKRVFAAICGNVPGGAK